MLFGQIGFHCPYDGQVQAGFDCVEDMIVHDEGKTEISVRCPKCGTLVRISSQAPIIPQGVLEQLVEELHITKKDGKLNFSDLIGQIASGMNPHGEGALYGSDEDSCADCHSSHNNLEEMAQRELTQGEGNQLEYFSRELEKIESVDDFLNRVNEETR